LIHLDIVDDTIKPQCAKKHALQNSRAILHEILDSGKNLDTNFMNYSGRVCSNNDHRFYAARYNRSRPDDRAQSNGNAP
jgi:hypothetical protein